jgi:hypothetical protein
LIPYVCLHVHRNAGIDLFLFDLKACPWWISEILENSDEKKAG